MSVKDSDFFLRIQLEEHFLSNFITKLQTTIKKNCIVDINSNPKLSCIDSGVNELHFLHKNVKFINE